MVWADDVIKASDYRISPFELESALIEHESVAEAAVVPAPDALRTAVPKAFIALAQGILPTRETALAIFRHSRERFRRALCRRQTDPAGGAAGSAKALGPDVPCTIQAHPSIGVLRAAENYLRKN